MNIFSNYKTAKKSQEGTLILLALLIMSSIITSAALIGTVVVREIRLSKDIENAILAFYASETAIEEALYKLRKDDVEPSVLNNNTGTLSNNSAWSRQVVEKVQDYFYDFLEKGRIFDFGLYDFLQPNEAGQVGSVQIQWKAGAVMKVTYKEWDGNSFINTVQSNYTCNQKPCTPVVVSSLNPASAYQFMIEAVGDDISDMIVNAYSSSSPSPGTKVMIFTPITVTASGEFITSKQGLEVTIDSVEPWD